MTNDLTPAYPTAETPTDLVPYTTHGHNIVAAASVERDPLADVLKIVDGLEDEGLQDMALELYSACFLEGYTSAADAAGSWWRIDAVVMARSDEKLNEDTGELSDYARTGIRATHKDGHLLDEPVYITFGSESARKALTVRARLLKGTTLGTLGVIDADKPVDVKWTTKQLGGGKSTYNFAFRAPVEGKTDGKK